jgi:hypothetical protein
MGGNLVPTGSAPARINALVSIAIPRIVRSVIFSANQVAPRVSLIFSPVFNVQ